jgi:hypothetical protein
MTQPINPLERLRLDLALAIAQCNRLQLPAHMVRNCPSDLQALDAAWRRRQNLEFQINQLEKKHAL